MSFLVMTILSILLFWVPVLGPFIAGYFGGKSAGGVINAVTAALLPALAFAFLVFSTGVVADLPVLGAILGGAAFLVMGVHVLPLVIGGMIGGMVAG